MENTELLNAKQMINPEIWANSGGLIGLVIFALFIELALFVWAQAKIYDMHRSDMRMLIDIHQNEREKWQKIIENGQKEINDVIRQLTNSINESNSRYRKFDSR